MGESYTSLILGIIAVIIVTILVISFVKQNNKNATDEEAMTDEQEGVHKVAEGETLWSISEAAYGSGYNWVDIAQANNIENPDSIEAGDELKLPDVEPKTLTVVGEAIGGEPEVMEEDAMNKEEVDDAMEAEEEKDSSDKITGDKYTVKQGEYLWDIAVRAYGDGYKWVEIARASKLANPDVIHAGNELSLPR